MFGGGGQRHGVGQIAGETNGNDQVLGGHARHLPRRVRHAARPCQRFDGTQVHAQATLQQAGQETAGAKTDDEHALGGQDGLHRLFTGTRVQRLQVALGVADVFFKRGGKDLHGAGGMRQFGAQLFHGFQRGFESASQLGTKLRVARQVQGARKAVRRRHRHPDRHGEFVDGHGGHAELMCQHVLGHLVLSPAQRGLSPGDPISDRQYGLVHLFGVRLSGCLCKSVYTQILNKKIPFHTKGIPVNLCNGGRKETGPV
ncbi:hypothetical protein D3C86_1490470 [compost metagenome]